MGFTAAAATTEARCAGGIVGALGEISAKLSKIEASLGSTEVPTETFMFTSESVNEGHPDKLADQVTHIHSPKQHLSRPYNTQPACMCSLFSLFLSSSRCECFIHILASASF